MSEGANPNRVCTNIGASNIITTANTPRDWTTILMGNEAGLMS